MFAQLWSAFQWTFFRNPLSRRLGRPLAALHIWLCTNSLPSIEWHPESRRLSAVGKQKNNKRASWVVVGLMIGSLVMYPMYATVAVVLWPQSLVPILMFVFMNIVAGAAAQQVPRLARVPDENGDLNDPGILEAGG